MDRSHCELLVRFFPSESRRGVLNKLAALGGIVFLTGGPEPASAARRRKRCKRGKKTCGSRCIAKSKCCKKADCLPGQTCSSGGTCRPASPGRLSAADPVWLSCNSDPGRYHFEAHPFTWPGGPIRITMTSDDFAMRFFFFERARFAPFSPDRSCDGARGAGGGAIGGEISFFSIDLPAGDYVLVPTSFSPGAIGAFTIDVEQAEDEE